MRQNLYQEALGLQQSKSIAGVVFGLTDIVQRIQNERTEAGQPLLEPAELQAHPAVVIIVHKLESMVESMAPGKFEEARHACEVAAHEKR